MAQTHDVMIDGAGYMLVPGSYRYEQKGADLVPVRAGVGSFETALGIGTGGPDVIDRDAVRWNTVGMMPVPIGLGNEAGRLLLAPAETPLNTGLSGTWDGNSRGIVYNGKVYVTVGAFLLSVNVNGSGQMTGLTLIGSAAGTITSMAVIGGLLYMACASPATTMSNYAGSGAIANTPAATAQVIWAYASGIWRTKYNAVNGAWDKISGSIDGGATWTDWELDSGIRAVVPWHGRATGGGVMLIATAGRLWELAGQWAGSPAVFSGTVSPLYEATGGGDPYDFLSMVEYQGHVFTWYAGTVHRWDGAALLPVAGGPRGSFYGMCVAGGYLCVATVDPAGMSNAVWCYDGVRWFLLQRSASVVYNNLFGSAGLISDGHLVSLNYTAFTVSRWAMPVQGLTSAPRASGVVQVGPLDAGQGDTIKIWTQLSVSWSTALYPSQMSAPVNPGGGLLIEYSVDDGSNWITAGTTVIANAARSGLAVQTVSVEAQRLLLRVTWTPSSAYAAFQIDSVYASGWKLGDTPKNEVWTFDVNVTDKLIRRDGSVDARSGEAMLQALRALTQTGRTFVFQDVDYDLNTRNVICRLVDLKEQTRKGDGTRFLESRIALTLTAVA